jgi:quinol monooxygenase YgiN
MILVTGELRLKPESVEQLRAAMRTVITANRQEDGCLLFAFGEDVLEPGVIRIVERWRDWDALAAHDRAPHVVAWRAALKDSGAVVGRDLVAHEASNPRAI